MTESRPSVWVRWSLDSAGRPEKYALLTGSSSIYHSLRCAIACAEELVPAPSSSRLPFPFRAVVQVIHLKDSFESSHFGRSKETLVPS